MNKLPYCLVLLPMFLLLLKWLSFIATVDIPYKLIEPEPVIAQTQDERIKQQVNKLLKNYDNYQRCTDIKSVTDPVKTKIELKGTDTVRLGGSICLNVYLFDGYGKAKTVGGDHLRARLFTKSLNAYTVGNVYDHKNGTYSAHFTAYWSGPATAEIEVLYPREIIAAILYRRNRRDSTHITAVFRNRDMTETTLCNTDIHALKQNIKKGDVCDFSYWNKRMLWLCLKPLKRKFSCNHLEKFNPYWPKDTRWSLNKCETDLANRWMSAAKTVNISVLPKDVDGRQVKLYQPRTECTAYNTTKLWYNTKPTGYFYKGNWKLLHCKGLPIISEECLRNKTLYLWGDSTTFHWYAYITHHAECGCKVETGAERWKQQANCYCGKYNMWLIWIPHSVPFKQFHKVIRHHKSLYQQISEDRRSSTMKSILVVHLYSHIQTFSLTFSANNLIRLREDIEHLMNDDVYLKVFIKLPHTHREFKHMQWMITQPDIIGYIYTNLIRTIFAGLHHRVVVLNNRDATNAIKSFPLHPNGTVIDGMIRQLLSYFCNMSDVTSH